MTTMTPKDGTTFTREDGSTGVWINGLPRTTCEHAARVGACTECGGTAPPYATICGNCCVRVLRADAARVDFSDIPFADLMSMDPETDSRDMGGSR